MKKAYLLVAALAATLVAQAALKPGDSLTPYEIKNVESGKKYCQVCAYGVKAAKLIGFGNLNDDKFWSDLKAMQELHSQFGSKLGVYAQVLDSTDTKAIAAKAKQHGITFPVVIAAEEDWNEAYKVNGVSRTIYYARKNTVAWSNVGLDNGASDTLKKQVSADLKG